MLTIRRARNVYAMTTGLAACRSAGRYPPAANVHPLHQLGYELKPILSFSSVAYATRESYCSRS